MMTKLQIQIIVLDSTDYKIVHTGLVADAILVSIMMKPAALSSTSL